MRKMKIYLDTSVIRHLDAPDTPEKQADTLRLWEDIKNGEYEVVLSNVTILEIEDCPEPKRTVLEEYLELVSYSLVIVDEQAMLIAEKFIDFGILRQKSFDDCQHIAAAIVSRCDAIISWNFKHIVNHKTMAGVKAITALEGYNDLMIYTPSILIGGDYDDE